MGFQCKRTRTVRATGDSMTISDVKDARERFVGVWTLESFTEESDHDEESSPLGEQPLGFLIYTAGGFVSAQLMRAKRELLRSDPWETGNSNGVDLTKD